jgi:hypothetical protein
MGQGRPTRARPVLGQRRSPRPPAPSCSTSYPALQAERDILDRAIHAAARQAVRADVNQS